MDFKTIIEQERSKFVDGKIPSTHIMYDQYMATMDWNGEWTEEQRAFARRLVAEKLTELATKDIPGVTCDNRSLMSKGWGSDEQKSQARTLRQIVEYVERRELKRAERKPHQKQFRMLTTTEQEKFKTEVWVAARKMCTTGQIKGVFRDVLQKWGYDGDSPKEFIVRNGIMSNEQYDSVMLQKKWPMNYGQYNLPLPNQQAARPQ
jgi:hypothetical protein